MIVAIMVIVGMTAYILCWSDARLSTWVMPEMPGLIIAKSFTHHYGVNRTESESGGKKGQLCPGK